MALSGGGGGGGERSCGPTGLNASIINNEAQD